MDSLAINTRLTVTDWRAYQRAAFRRLRTEEPTKSVVLRLVLALAIGIGVAYLLNRLDAPEATLGIVAGIAFVMLLSWFTVRVTRRYVPQEDAAFLAEQSYEFGPAGFHANRRGMTSFSSWSVVKAVAVSGEYLYLWIDKSAGHVVPFRDLPAGVGRDEFVRQVQVWSGSQVAPDEQWSVTGSAAATPASIATSEAPGATTNASDTPTPQARRSGWFTTLMRLLTLRSAADAPATAGAGLLALLAGLGLAAWVGISWLDNQPDPEFYVYGTAAIAWYVLMALVLAAVLAWRSMPRVAPCRVLAIVLAGAPILIVARYLIDRYLWSPWATVASALLFVYFIGYGARALHALSGRPQPSALAGGAVMALLMAWATERVYVDSSLWLSSEADDEETEYETTWKASESLLFSQSQRIDSAIDAIHASNDASPAAFFVGFAGYAEERVFAEEIRLASRIVARRYDTQDRSILLVNDRRSLEAQPLASPTALRYTLRHLATKMNTERDILFLALSSHGSVNSLSVSNRPLALQDLTAGDLAAALQESGIKWRVIVVSACHAGSFIDELRNPQTIVITASAADKTSFGCSDDRDLTYFGEAFYRDSLPGSKSLREAFDKAKAEIAAREKHEGVKASDPQAFFGEAIEKHLAAFGPGT